MGVHKRRVFDRPSTVELRKLLGSWSPPRRGPARVRQSAVIAQLDELLDAFPRRVHRAVTIEIRRRTA